LGVTVTGYLVLLDTPTQTLSPQVFLHMTTHNFNDMVTRSGVAFGTSGARGLVADLTDELCYPYASASLASIS
jgi:hypothetical protein